MLNATQRAEKIARLETINQMALAAGRDLNAEETSEWLTIRKELNMPAEVQQPDPATLRRADSPSATVVTKVRKYSVLKAIGMLLGDSNAGDVGLEREVHQEMLKGRTSTKGVLIPYSAFLGTKSSDGQDSLSVPPGGALAATDVLLTNLLADVEAAILRATILGPLGVGAIAIPSTQKARIPLKKVRGKAGWISRDGSGSVQDLVFDEIEVEPSSLAIAAQLNRSSLIYTPMMESLVRQDLADSWTDEVNNSYLNGAGSANAPVGLIKFLTDATSVDHTGEINTGIGLAAVTAFINDHVGAYAEDSPGRKWLVHPNFRLAITASPIWPGGVTPISDGKTLAGYPVVSSLRAETGGTPYVVFGDFDTTWVISFGPALDLLANPFADSVYLAGGMLLRGISDLSYVFRDKSRFSMASDAQAVATVPAP